MQKVRITRSLNHMTLIDLHNYVAQEKADVEFNDGVAEEIVLEVKREDDHDKMVLL